MSIPVTSVDSPKKTRVGGCLAALGVTAAVFAVFGTLLYRDAQRSHRDHEMRAAIRRTNDVNEILAGNDGSRISIRDPKLIAMVASDRVCIAKLANLNLFMADLDAPEFAQVSRLTNVQRIYAYSCHGVDALITRLEAMPAVEELNLEATALAEMSIRRLPTVFPNLRKLTCNWVVDEAEERMLKESLPNVEIEIPYPASKESK